MVHAYRATHSKHARTQSSHGRIVGRRISLALALGVTLGGLALGYGASGANWPAQRTQTAHAVRRGGNILFNAVWGS